MTNAGCVLSLDATLPHSRHVDVCHLPWAGYSVVCVSGLCVDIVTHNHRVVN